MASSTLESTCFPTGAIFFWLRQFFASFSLIHTHPSLAAAKTIDLRRQFGITHLVSVCPDVPLEGPNHLIIPVHDSEYDDILIYLPNACRFIQKSLDSGGRVLVHCHMGISRSATVIAAYCEIVAPWKRLNVDRNLPRISDVNSPNSCPKGDCYH